MFCFGLLCFALFCFALLYFTLLCFTLLCFTLYYYTLYYFTLLYFTLLYFILLYFIFYFILFYLHYFTLFYFTLLYFTLLFFTLLLLCFALPYFIKIYSITHSSVYCTTYHIYYDSEPLHPPHQEYLFNKPLGICWNKYGKQNNLSLRNQFSSLAYHLPFLYLFLLYYVISVKKFGEYEEVTSQNFKICREIQDKIFE